MVDEAKLPRRAVLDTTIVIRALGQRPTDPDAPLCKAFWDAMLRKNRQILVTAMTVAEISRSDKYAPLSLPPVSGIIPIGFDGRAARELAKKLPDRILKRQLPEGFSRTELEWIRYDALIVACALVNNAPIVTLDVEMRKLANLAGGEGQLVTHYADAQKAFAFQLPDSRRNPRAPSRRRAAVPRKPRAISRKVTPG